MLSQDVSPSVCLPISGIVSLSKRLNLSLKFFPWFPMTLNDVEGHLLTSAVGSISDNLWHLY